MNTPPKWHDLKGSLVEIKPISGAENFVLTIKQQNSQKKIIQSVWNTRQKIYNKKYPAVTTFKNDPYDRSACVIFTRTNSGEISSTARIAFNGDIGIPEKALIPSLLNQLNENNTQFAELGRFVIDEQARGVLKHYFHAFYYFGTQYQIATYIILVQQKSVPFYTRLLRANVVEILEETFGSNSPYAVLRWDLKNTSPRFFSWCGAQAVGIKPINNNH